MAARTRIALYPNTFGALECETLYFYLFLLLYSSCYLYASVLSHEQRWPPLRWGAITHVE